MSSKMFNIQRKIKLKADLVKITAAYSKAPEISPAEPVDTSRTTLAAGNL